MNINLNGSPYSLTAGISIQELLGILDLQQKRVAVEVNGNIIPRSQHAEKKLNAGDKVEVIHAIGGG